MAAGTLYRQDCSGFVSMAWHINVSGTNNGFTTNSAVNYSTQLAGPDSLKPGDTLNNISAHMVLFVGWNDSGHTSATIYEEPNSQSHARSRTMTRSEMTSGGYFPYHYDKIVDDTKASAAGVYRPSNQTFYLTNDNASVAVAAKFGNPDDLPLVGDWDGNRTDKVGVYRPTYSDFYGAAKDSNAIIYSARFGSPGDTPIVGQW